MPQIFQEAHSEQIKAWLTTELPPICDAEPEVLSDYIIALLKHDASEAELAALLNEQLADFLDSNTNAFVTKLVSTLSTQSYLPPEKRPLSESAQEADAAAAATAAATSPSSSRKRPAEEEGRRSPPKNPRALDSAVPTGPRGGGGGGGGGGGAAASAAKANGAERGTADGSRERDVREKKSNAPIQESDKPAQQQQQQGQQPRGLCRDFHQKGWCSRGQACRYEHSTDAITGGAPGNLPGPPGKPNGGNNLPPQGFAGSPQMPMAQMPQMGQMPPGHFNGMRPGPGFMPRPPMPGFPMNPAMFGAPQGWNGGGGGGGGGAGSPRPIAHSPGGQSGPASPHGGAGGPLVARMGEQRHDPGSPLHMMGAGSPPQPFPGAPMGMPPMNPNPAEPSQRGGHAGRGRGRGSAPGHFQNRARSTTTLVIENVPADSLDLIKINDYFKRFGTITNIQIDQPSAKALVSYSNPAEAKAAHESPDVIFGNRFVKVYFQKLDEPLDGARPQAIPTPRPQPPPKQSFAAGQNVYRPPGAASNASASSSSAPGPSAEQVAARKQAVDTQRAAQEKVDQLITEQKQLFAKLGGGSASPEEKKSGMARLRALEPLIKEATEEVRKAVAAIAALPPTMNASAAPFDSAKRQEQKEKMERERLDRELEAHSKGSNTSTQTEDLRAKLEALKAEAASLGLNGENGRGGYARGRARAAYRGAPRGRGRGGVASGGSMRLDNRPTRLVVSDLPEGKDPQRVKEWLKSFGDVASFEGGDSEGGDGDGNGAGDGVAFFVTFQSRQSGEQAMRSGLDVPDVGKIKLAWAPASASAGAGAGAAAAAAQSSQAVGGGGNASGTASPAPAAAAEEEEEEEEEDGQEDDGDNWKR